MTHIDINAYFTLKNQINKTRKIFSYILLYSVAMQYVYPVPSINY